MALRAFENRADRLLAAHRQPCPTSCAGDRKQRFFHNSAQPLAFSGGSAQPDKQEINVGLKVNCTARQRRCHAGVPNAGFHSRS